MTINLRMTIPEACKYYAANVTYNGDYSQFGRSIREETTPEDVTWFDLHRCFEHEIISLYAKHSGTDDPWVKVDPYYYYISLILWSPRLPNEDWRIMPRCGAIVPCDFSVLRKEVMYVLKHPQAAIRKAGYELRHRFER